MAYYVPRQGLIWYYKKSEGLLKLVSTVTFEIDVSSDVSVTSECSGVVDETAAVINFEVLDTGTQASSPVTIVSQITVDDIGTNKDKIFVEAKILAHEPILVQANIYRNDERQDSGYSIGDENTKLEYEPN
jgi:hypothetical protein